MIARSSKLTTALQTPVLFQRPNETGESPAAICFPAFLSGSLVRLGKRRPVKIHRISPAIYRAYVNGSMCEK
jgi:hypothetical protein